MLRLRYLSWLVICAVLLSIVAPALPAHAASNAALPSPLRQDDVVERIAEIRSGEPDLEDTFDDPNSLFQTGYDGTTSAYLKSGELRIAVDDENTLAWSKMSQKVGDFYAEVDTIHREGSLDNQFGFLARFDDEGNYYLFAASSDGYYTIQLFQDGEWEPIIEWEETETIDIDEGSLNTLGLLAEGDSYSFLINDTIVESVTDDALDGTILALNAAAFEEPPIDMGFDNFRLWYVGDPIEVAPRQAPIDGRKGTTEPSATPTPEGTDEATEEATEEATIEPTPEETSEPTAEPTEESTAEPTAESTPEPTEEATPEPTAEATEEATAEPTVTTGSSSDPAVAAIQGQPATFSDDFEDGDASDWAPFPNDALIYEVVDGVFDFVFNTPNVLSWSELPETPARYYLEVDATLASPVEAAEYGIVFNFVDSQNFYLYAINNSNRYSVWRLVNNSWEMVADWADSTVLLSGEGNTNRLGLLVDGTSVTLAANDETLTTLEIDDVEGSAALAAGTFDEADLTMSFDNVSLWDLDALAPLPTAEATGEPTAEPTEEPTDEPVSGDFAEVSLRIEEIVATDPDISDDFRRDTGNWLTESDDFGEYYYESRAFNIEAAAEERIVWSNYYADAEATEAMVFNNFYIEFDTSFVVYTGENASGLVFRLVDTDNFYKFLVDEIGYFQLQKRVEGDYSDVIEWAITDEVDDSEGAVNRIGILAEGSTLAFTVNGVVIAQAEDADLDSGSVALAIQTYGTPEAHSIFDNFDLWILD